MTSDASGLVPPPRPPSLETHELKPVGLMQRGNYAMFRTLSIIAASGTNDIRTVVLHQELGALLFCYYPFAVAAFPLAASSLYRPYILAVASKLRQ